MEATVTVSIAKGVNCGDLSSIIHYSAALFLCDRPYATKKFILTLRLCQHILPRITQVSAVTKHGLDKSNHKILVVYEI